MNIIEILEKRFKDNMNYHQNVNWDDVLKKLNKKEIVDAINFMEETKGEPNVFIFNDKLVVVNSVKEQPKKRVSLCYDEEALINRKKFPPTGSVLGLLKNMQLRLLNEEEYFILQSYGDFDLKGSSWLDTDSKFRSLGGALYGSKRYKRTFIFHNGADSYYNNRGFRTILYIE